MHAFYVKYGMIRDPAENPVSIMNAPCHCRKQLSVHSSLIFITVYHALYDNKLFRTFSAKTTPKHLYRRMFGLLLYVSRLKKNIAACHTSRRIRTFFEENRLKGLD